MITADSKGSPEYILTIQSLNITARYAILILQKEQPPQYKGLAHKKIENSTLLNTPMFYKGGFSMPVSRTL